MITRARIRARVGMPAPLRLVAALLVTAHSFAWERPPIKCVGRRAFSGGLLAAAAFPRAALAAKGGVQWSLEVPEGYLVQRQLASIVRVKLETMFAAEDATTGASIKLLLLPFGKQVGGSLDADEQLTLAKHFFDAKATPDGPALVATTMVNSAKRSPSVRTLSSVGAARGYDAADGTRYVRYRYESERCSEPLDDGECFGMLSKKRTMATVAMSSISQYRTNTERERMKELGQSRNVNVLWLLTLTAPDSAWSKLEPAFEGISNSFAVPLEPS